MNTFFSLNPSISVIGTVSQDSLVNYLDKAGSGITWRMFLLSPMKSLTIWGTQGTGKTTIASKIAAANAARGRETIIYDNCIETDLPSIFKFIDESDSKAQYLILMQECPKSFDNKFNISIEQLKELIKL